MICVYYACIVALVDMGIKRGNVMEDEWLVGANNSINYRAEVMLDVCKSDADRLKVEIEWYVEEFLKAFRKEMNKL